MEGTDMFQEEIEPLLKYMALHLKRSIDERDEHSEGKASARLKRVVGVTKETVCSLSVPSLSSSTALKEQSGICSNSLNCSAIAGDIIFAPILLDMPTSSTTVMCQRSRPCCAAEAFPAAARRGFQLWVWTW
ncbi:hypothetical protein MC885_000534 [Smutsia gigantea]|nr:hypothetical protein MC885_000534 [Smutsia gigantea]